MLQMLGLHRSQLSSREVDLIPSQTGVEQRDLIATTTMAAENALKYHYGVVPEQSQEDALHAIRLLAVEEKAFSRVQRSLLGKDSLLRKYPHQLPSPPPEGQDGAIVEPLDPSGEAFKRQQFREEVLLDFASLESSILRIQLIHSSNRRERERYATEKNKITDEAQAVRDNTLELRVELEEAQQVRERRKEYDQLASKILDDKRLMSREQCQTEITTLEKEIEELQQESAEVDTAWISRRAQFDRVVAEGESMVRLIKGIRDEPEQMEDEEDDEMDDGQGDNGTRGESSRMGTPGADGRTPMRGDGGETPMLGTVADLGTGDDTLARPVNRFLEVEGSTRPSSGAASPSRLATVVDIDMTETAGDATMALSQASTGIEALASQGVEAAGDATEVMDET
ncbi:hypothetical protein LTR62_001183 [Meristemomyces frigidus]|uniref:Uncharacterized protein n=1 Tax=Meristemomyces frigidus TaxID=1508187 RepID=A0AAN7YID2_9PEZI|nr:hypothetical protein LTR62_001183 [Meristemomyces frigidus]